MQTRPLLWISFPALLITCPAASAHSRWFLNGQHLPQPPSLVFDTIHAAMIAAILLFVATGVVLVQLARSNRVVGQILYREVHLPAYFGWRALSVAFGSMLVINSLMNVFVAPDQLLGDGFLFQLVAFLQVVVGSMFILQSRLLVASMLALLLPVGCWSLFSFGHAIDYAFELFGIAAALFLMAPVLSPADRAVWQNWFPYSPVAGGAPDTGSGTAAGAAAAERRTYRAVSVLRVMFGLQLIVLAAHDKILYPETSLAFLARFPFVNFPALAGVPGFTDLHFVTGAGLAEIAFGAMLIGNIATRMVCAILVAIFTLTGLVFGGEELVGHVPIVAAILVLLCSRTASQKAAVAPRRADIVMFGTVSAACAAMVLGAFVLQPPAGPVDAAQSDPVRHVQS